MKPLEYVEKYYNELPSMKHNEAEFIEYYIEKYNCNTVAEFGSGKGKSTAYIASIISNRNGIVYTHDIENLVNNRTPNIFQVINYLNLNEYVIYNNHKSSISMSLMYYFEKYDEPIFDMLYVDDIHLWDITSSIFLLADKLLKPNGLVVFDDLNVKPIIFDDDFNKVKENYYENEMYIEHVNKIWEYLLPKMNYEKLEVTTFDDGNKMGLAQKLN